MRCNLDPTLSYVFFAPAGYRCVRSYPTHWSGGRVGVGALVGEKYGITAPLLARALPHTPRLCDMRGLSLKDAHTIAHTQLWEPAGCDDAPAGVDALLFLHALTVGAAPSVRLLQRLVDVEADGVLGPQTVRACVHVAPDRLIACLRRSITDALTTPLNSHSAQLCAALVALQEADRRRRLGHVAASPTLRQISILHLRFALGLLAQQEA